MRKMYLPRNNFQRFVFYTSLNNDEKVSSTNSNYTGADAYTMAMERMNKIRTENIGEKNFKVALNLLESMIKNEKEKEVAFIKDKILNNPLIHNKIKDEARNLTAASENFDYLHFTTLLNNIYFESKLLLEKVEAESKRVKRMTEVANQGIKRYRGAYFQNMSEEENKNAMTRIKKEKGTHTLREELFKGNANKTPYLMKDTIRELRSLLDQRQGDLYFSNLTKQNYSKIVRLITEKLQEKEAYQDLIRGFVNDKEIAQANQIIEYAILHFLQNAYAEDISNRIKEVNARKSTSSALLDVLKDSDTYRNENRFSAETEKLIDEFINQWGGAVFSDELLLSLSKAIYEREGKDISLSTKEIKEKLNDYKLFTKKGRKRKDFEKNFQNLQEEEKEEATKLLELLDTAPKKISPLKIKNNGKLWFQAEIDAALENLITQNVISVIQTGNSGNKDDFIATSLFYELPTVEVENNELDNILKSAENKIEKIIKNYSNIITTEKALTKEMDSENIQKRNEIILNASIQMQEEIDKQTNKLKNYLKEEKDLITNVFVEHGSVKDYSFLDNDIGFNSGVMGSGSQRKKSKGNTELFSALENIAKMAELGGLAKLDINRLAFAAINCSDFLIGGELGLKNPLENYLSILAGALMFNDCELIMREVNEKLKKSLPSSIKQIHIYRLNGVYVPFSYVLQLTYEAMKDLEIEVEKYANKGFHVQLVNDYYWEDFSKQIITRNTWKETGEKAISHTTIKMSFLAGFADILDGLAKSLSQ